MRIECMECTDCGYLHEHQPEFNGECRGCYGHNYRSRSILDVVRDLKEEIKRMNEDNKQ